MCVFVYAYIDLLYKHMGNNMVLGIMNINLTYDPNSKKISGIISIYTNIL